MAVFPYFSMERRASMPSIDDLMCEIAQLRTENDMLKILLKENGIDLPNAVADPALQDE